MAPIARNKAIIYFDSVIALLEGHVRTGHVNVIKIYDTDQDAGFVPVLPIPLHN